MKRVLFLVFIAISLQTNANESLIEIRDLFYSAAKSIDSTEKFVLKLANVNESSSPILIGYKSMAHLMTCLHSYNPYTKFKYFGKGKDLLEKAISKDTSNLELRFLRLCVQLQTPKFLGYSTNITEDKLAIFNGIPKLKDEDLKKRILDYTTNAKKLSTEEKRIFMAALKQNSNDSNN